MNKEMINRLKMAGKYQKKAIYALFPEKVSKHLDVIEKELKMMAVEIAADVVKECRKCDSCGGAQEHVKESEVKKVDIV
ncbi:MAG: hypothetical protein K2N44_18785 [Lachnospiraceae bacterium]|nr:hypothetical protein [Lachnospiraceae bacterium]